MKMLLFVCVLAYCITLSLAAEGYSFKGVVMNITKLINREGTHWFALAWDAKSSRMMKYPFHEDDTNTVQPYCLFPRGLISDIEADKYPTGPTIDYFGAPSSYSKIPIRALKDKTVAMGIIVRNKKVEYSSQNMCVLDAFNATLVSWRLRDARRLDKTQYVFVNRDSFDEHKDWKRITAIDWVEYRDHAGTHFPHIGEDMRLIKLQSDPSRIFVNWCLNREENGLKFVTFHFAELHYPGLRADGSMKSVMKNSDSLYVKWPGHKVNMYHEVTPRSEKNWPMFEYVNTTSPHRSRATTAAAGAAEDEENVLYEGMSEKDRKFWHDHLTIGHGDTGGGNLLFIHSLQPLRIVTPTVLPHHRANYNITGDTSAQSVSMSVVTNFCWNYGKLRGGTSPQLVDLPPGYTSYGGLYQPEMEVKNGGTVPVPPQPQKEYLGFFHSNVHMAQHLVMTYNLGAYTFTAEPPFRITAMSALPIVSPDWMESFTYKHTDIVVFPMSFEHDVKYVNVSYGWDESDGYVLTLDKKILFDSLRPTHTDILGKVDEPMWHSAGRPDPATWEYSIDWYKRCEKMLGETNCADFRRRRRLDEHGATVGGDGGDTNNIRRRLRHELHHEHGYEQDHVWGATDELWLDSVLREKWGGA
jgi:hypothetical protein